MNTLDDATLIEEIQRGRSQIAEAAFGELLQRHSVRLQRYLGTKGLSSQEREDIAAETWLRAWQGIDRYEFRQEIGFFPWLRTITNNVMSEFTRKHYLERAADASEVGLVTIADEHAASEAVVHLTREEIAATINSILVDVPNDDWRIVIAAHLIDGWQTADIMELHDWSRSKVDTTKFRAFQWLKTQLLDRIDPTDIDAWLENP